MSSTTGEAVNNDHHPVNRKADARKGPDHSELAMQAAKRMQRSRQKEKNGRIICLHLLGMLADETETGATRSVKAKSASSSAKGASRVTRRETKRYWIEPLQIDPENGAEKQYSLLF